MMYEIFAFRNTSFSVTVNVMLIFMYLKAFSHHEPRSETLYTFDPVHDISTSCRHHLHDLWTPCVWHRPLLSSLILSGKKMEKCLSFSNSLKKSSDQMLIKHLISSSPHVPTLCFVRCFSFFSGSDENLQPDRTSCNWSENPDHPNQTNHGSIWPGLFRQTKVRPFGSDCVPEEVSHL